jgi:hypothetical protein
MGRYVAKVGKLEATSHFHKEGLVFIPNNKHFFFRVF